MLKKKRKKNCPITVVLRRRAKLTTLRREGEKINRLSSRWVGEKEGEVSKLVFYAQSSSSYIRERKGKKKGDVSKKKITKSPGKGKQIQGVEARELLTKYCWIVYKLQQWVEKPGKDDKASFATDLDRQCLAVPDDAAQLNDRLHVGHGRLNLRVDQVFPCLGQWQEVDATCVFGRSSLTCQQVAHVLIHQLREERGEGCLGREGIKKMHC